MGDDVLPGLGDPVFDSSAIFRAVLDAMAHPGKIIECPAPPSAPAGLNAPACGVLLALCDMDTPLWLAPGCDTPAARRHLIFHTGAPVVETPGRAAFAIAASREDMGFLESLSLGIETYPDRSATLVLMVETLSDEADVVLRGPGIRERAAFSARPLGEAFWTWRARSRDLFPLGVDVILASPAAFAALPRSTEVER